MKVSNQVPVKPQLIDKAKETETSAATPFKENLASQGSGGPQGTRVEISDTAQLMKQASEIAKSAPDVRQERVNSLKKSIQDGTYQVDSRAVADRLVDEHLRHDFGKNLL